MTIEHEQQSQTPALKTWMPPFIEDVSLRGRTEKAPGSFETLSSKNGS